MSVTLKPKFFLLIRCEDPKFGTSFCVISDLAVYFDSENLNLQLNREIKFDYPEDDAIFQWPHLDDVDGEITNTKDSQNPKKAGKRGRKAVKNQKKSKTYSGTVIKKSSKIFSLKLRFFIQNIFQKRMFYQQS